MLSTLLYLIDQFGRPVTINFSGRDKYKSKFGGICTIVFAGFIIWALYNTSTDLFEKTNPKSLQSETYSDDPRQMILTPDSFPFSIGIQTPAAKGLLPYIDDSIYNVTFRYIRRFKTQLANGTIKETTKTYNLKKEICTSANFGIHSHHYDGVEIDKTFCIARDQPEIKELKMQGVYASPEYEYVLALLRPCKNGTSVVCKTPSEIETYLTTGWFNVLFVNTAVDPKNYTHPDTRYREIYSTMMSTANYKETTFSLGHVSVTTDSGWIVPELNTEEYIMVNKINEIVQFAPDTLRNLTFSAIFEVNPMETHHFRSYKTIQNVLAEVGGLANIALVVLFFLTLPYLKLRFSVSLINELFDIHLALPQRKTENKNKKKRRSNKKKNSAALSVENDKDDSDPEKPKNTNELQTSKNDDVEVRKEKSNRRSDSVIAKSPLFSRISSVGGKDNKNPDWKELKIGEEALSPNYLPLEMHSPKEEKNIKESRQINTLVESDTERIRIYYDGQTKQTDEGESPVKTLFVKGSRLARLTTQANPKSDWEGLRDGKESPPVSARHVPLEIIPLPVNQQKEDNTPLDPKENIESGYGQENENMKSSEEREQHLDKDLNSPDNKSNIELMRIPHDRKMSRYSSIYSKQQLIKVNQKDIAKPEQYTDPILISSVDEFYSPETCPKDQENFDSDCSVENEMEKIDCDANPAKDIEARDGLKGSVPQRAMAYTNKPLKIDISFGEYLCSFFYKSPALRQKMDILAQGKRNIRARLDLISILKKLREIDKLKAMLLDIDQAILFNNLPNPEIKAKELKLTNTDASFTQQILRKPTFIDRGETASMVVESHRKLQGKTDKNQIDQRLIAVFKDKIN